MVVAQEDNSEGLPSCDVAMAGTELGRNGHCMMQIPNPPVHI